MKKFILDSNLMGNKTIADMVDMFNRRMIIDIEYVQYDYKTDFNIPYHTIALTVKTLHMEFGQMTYYFHIENLATHNKDVLLTSIYQHFEGITGCIA